MTTRVGRLATALAVATPVLLVALAGPAHAHNGLQGTTPSADASVESVPDAVVLRFDQAVLGIGTAVRVTGPDGDVQSGAAEVTDDTVRQPVAAGAPAGDYTVSWRVTSADGHPISGTFAFTSDICSRSGNNSPDWASSSASVRPDVVGSLMLTP